jgi:flagellar hook-associated protein 3 FlgL
MIQNLNIVGLQFLASFQSLNQRMATTEAQLSSGVTISKPSDNPGELGDVLQLESDLGKVKQVASNLSQVTGEVNTAESSLETSTQLLQQVTTLGEQGANSTTTAGTRAALALQVQNVLQELVGQSNTTFDGQYVFNGELNTPPYQLDLTNPNGVDRLNASPPGRLIQDATGVTFAVSQTAQNIFDHRNPDDSLASDNVFAAVNSLRAALANNDQAGIANALSSVQTAQGYFSQQLAFYGAVQDQVSNATDVAQKFQLQDQTSLGQLVDTNIATASVDLTQEQASLQASLQAQASMPKTSLFDFLSTPTG